MVENFTNLIIAWCIIVGSEDSEVVENAISYHKVIEKQ